MSEPTLRPIWTPDDARQTAHDARQHQAFAVLDCSLGAGRHRAPSTGRPATARVVAATAALIILMSVAVLWATGAR
jgi:hypothetical protein